MPAPAPALIILGARDPEMEEIERLVRAHRCDVGYAVDDGGRRVTPAQAYDCGVELPLHVRDAAPVRTLLVECSPRGLVGEVIDHHRAGDPGYGRPPAEYLSGSSVGQVVRALGLDQCRVCRDTIDWADRHGLGGAPCLGVADQGVLGGMGPCGDLHGWPMPVAEYARVRLVAAADHCLAAAYRGECPGVSPDELMRWRAETRAAFQGRAVDTVLADVEATRAALRMATRLTLLGLGDMTHTADHDWSSSVCDGCARGPVEVADMRREPPWPELPEAAAREGAAYVSGPLRGPDGRAKYTCAGDPDVVRAFMAWAERIGLVDAYGDPERGFGGAYAPGGGSY
jgi:hypothetical protein